ncbi:MAG: Glu/Leu/Phe/Val dehydrogenase [Polyangiaceae bacterium]|nr:Glu/Leu/Phe/Val dehydrogenase [Polyangiaceae bacterium]
MIFDSPHFDDHEHISFFRDAESGLRAIVAIHSTAPFGIAGGGCRFWSYASDEEALADALRLSRAMSYKLALCEMPAGGAKSVIIGDPRKDKSEAVLRAMGRAVERLGGKYIIAEDVGTNEEDMRIIGEETRFVVGKHTDTGPATAYGAFLGMCEAARRVFGKADFAGLRVAVQGVGNVGSRVCKYLAESGARLVVCDVNEAAVREIVKRFGAESVSPDAIYDVKADVFAPCALGATLNDRTIPRLGCKLVAGAANNQLAEERHADALAEKGIVYAPDFVLNAGGVIGASQEGTQMGSAGSDV